MGGVVDGRDKGPRRGVEDAQSGASRSTGGDEQVSTSKGKARDLRDRGAEQSDVGAGVRVELENFTIGTGGRTGDVQVAVGTERDARRSGQRTSRADRLNEPAGGPVVLQNTVRGVARDEQIAVGAELHPIGEAQTVVPGRNERAHERAGGPVVFQNVVCQGRVDVNVAVGTDRNASGIRLSVERPQAGPGRLVERIHLAGVQVGGEQIVRERRPRFDRKRGQQPEGGESERTPLQKLQGLHGGLLLRYRLFATRPLNDPRGPILTVGILILNSCVSINFSSQNAISLAFETTNRKSMR